MKRNRHKQARRETLVSAALASHRLFVFASKRKHDETRRLRDLSHLGCRVGCSKHWCGKGKVCVVLQLSWKAQHEHVGGSRRLRSTQVGPGFIVLKNTLTVSMQQGRDFMPLHPVAVCESLAGSTAFSRHPLPFPLGKYLNK